MSDHGVPSEFQGRIAVIDTQISASLVESLSGKKVPARTVTQSGVYESGFPDQLSHGTVCTALAAENFPKAELLAVSAGLDSRASVEDVCAALSWCSSQNIDALFMSMGVTQGLDAPMLCKASQLLAAGGTSLFCASSNNGLLTFPAACPWAINIWQGPYGAGVWRYKPQWGMGVAVGDFSSSLLERLGKSDPIYRQRTTSMAVSFAAAEIMRVGSVADLPKFPFSIKGSKGDLEEWNIPIIRILGERGNLPLLMNRFLQEDYWAVFASPNIETNWPEMRVQVKSISELASLMPHLQKVNLLFLEMEDENGGSDVPWDLEVNLDAEPLSVIFQKIKQAFS